jgi:hypothetical protein
MSEANDKLRLINDNVQHLRMAYERLEEIKLMLSVVS